MTVKTSQQKEDLGEIEVKRHLAYCYLYRTPTTKNNVFVLEMFNQAQT